MNTTHKTHNVLGHYCWTCKAKTEAGIPGWPKAHNGDYTHYSPWASNQYGGVTTAIIWANGDASRGKDGSLCNDCEKLCGNPVEPSFQWGKDPYNSIVSKMLK